MQELFFILIISLLTLFSTNGQTITFNEVDEIKIETPYEKQTKFYKWYYDSTFYEKARLTEKFECLKLNYKSDTAFVEAWLYKSIQSNNKYPLIIYNRGGMGNFGKSN